VPELCGCFLGLVGQPLERGEREPQLHQRDAGPLKAQPSEPSDRGLLVARGVGAAEKEADPQRILQVDRGELRSRSSNLGEVAAVEGAAKVRVRAAL
jgi:hypothetical protein